MGNYVFELAMGAGGSGSAARGSGSRRRRSAAGCLKRLGRWLWRWWWPGGQAAARGYAIVIQTGPDDFWVAGANLGINFIHRRGNPMASLAAVEEGKFVNGAWWWTPPGGDDTAWAEATGQLRLTAIRASCAYRCSATLR